MTEQYYIISQPSSGFSATEIAGIAAKAIRAQDRKAKVKQYPLTDGGDGTIEHIVTSSLGSFLEVEATGADGEQLVVPLGFSGENGTIGIIEMRQIAAEPEQTTKPSGRKGKGLKFGGTTYGIGELIQDALDEGAFSIILGWDEPLARDGGFGMAQALGVKFLDKDGKELDFKKETPIHEVKSIDLSSRPFQLLSSRFYVARSASVSHLKSKGQSTVDDALIEDELSRVAKENNLAVNVSSLRSGGSYIDFAMTAFLNAEIKDGALLSLEASQLEAALFTNPGTIFFFGVRIEDIASEKASSAAKEVIRLASLTKNPLVIVTEESAKPASVTRYKGKIPELVGVYSLADVPLFVEPLAPDAPQQEKRRIMQMRIEKLSMRMLDELTETKITEIVKS